MLIVFQYIETLLLLFLVQLCNPVEIGVLVNNVRIIIRFFFGVASSLQITLGWLISSSWRMISICYLTKNYANKKAQNQFELRFDAAKRRSKIGVCSCQNNRRKLIIELMLITSTTQGRKHITTSALVFWYIDLDI